ncbi:hypothetical protein V7111_26270, partial [Neobacillus niacini]
NDSAVKDLYLDNDLSTYMKDKEALYDLLYDPGEKNNLLHHSNYVDILNELRDELRNWQERTNDPILQGPITKQAQWIVNKKTSVSPGDKDYE